MSKPTSEQMREYAMGALTGALAKLEGRTVTDLRLGIGNKIIPKYEYGKRVPVGMIDKGFSITLDVDLLPEEELKE